MKGKTIASSALSILLIGFTSHRLYVWITTGKLTSRFHPDGQYVSFDNDPIGFILGISYNGFAILCAVLLLLTVLIAE